MYLNGRTHLVLVFSLTLIVASTVDAFPRRLFRRSSYSGGSSGIKTIAPISDPATEGYRSLQAYFSYDKGIAEEVAFTDRIRVFMLVRDQEVLKDPDSVVAEVKLNDLSNQSDAKIQFCPVSFRPSTGEYQIGVFDVANEPGQETVVEPAKVYRMFVNLHHSADAYGKDTAIGKFSLPYYVATADDTRIGRARQHIAMRTFKEFYFAENGWRSEERYPMDCYAYYTWATGSCTVGAQNGMAMLHRLFGNRRPFHNGGAIKSLAQKSAIHGDYVRMPGHSFMLLAYDQKAGHVWTMEGNFNSTIKIVIRSVDPGWTVGHLVDEHIRPGMFQVSRAVEASSYFRVPL